MTHGIRCELAPHHRGSAPALARSFVHHQCRLADIDVTTTEALEVATCEVIENVMAVSGEVVGISLDPDFDGLDLLLSTSLPRSATAPFRVGLLARATFDEVVFDDNLIRMVRRFEERR